jgi:hypothetical protein
MDTTQNEYDAMACLTKEEDIGRKMVLVEHSSFHATRVEGCSWYRREQTIGRIIRRTLRLCHTSRLLYVEIVGN